MTPSVADRRYCSYECSNATTKAGERNYSWRGGDVYYWKQKARERDDFTCQLPGCGFRHEGKHSHAHHRIPRAAGGTDHLDNLITLCNKHHHVIEGLLLKRLVANHPDVVKAEVDALYLELQIPTPPPAAT